MNKHPLKFVVYGRRYCHLCDDMVAALRERQSGADFSLEVIDVDSDPALDAQYGEWVPVLYANGERLCHYHLDVLKVDEYLRNFG